MAFDNHPLVTEDLQARAVSRTLSQFHRSPVFLDVLGSLIIQVAELQVAIAGVVDGRAPYGATGAQLDVLGRIVGQDRILMNTSSEPWFAPDTSGVGADQGKSWVPGASSGANVTADDPQYRVLIEAKIYRNHVRYGSVPEIQAAVKRAFGVDISVIRTGMMQIKIVVPVGTPTDVINYLSSNRTDQRVDIAWVPPYPATTYVEGVVYDT